jgi:hypothetical protein
MMQAADKPKQSRGLDNSWQVVHLVLPFFKQYRLRLFLGFLSLMAVNGLQLLIPRMAS